MTGKRVLIIRSNPVDPDSRVEKEANALKKAGYDVYILGWDRNSDHELKHQSIELDNGTVPIDRIGFVSQYGSGIKSLHAQLRFQRYIFNYIKNKKYDIIHACDYDTAFAAFIAHNRGTKFIYDIFDYYVDAMRVPKSIKPFIKLTDRFVINHADATIICTENRMKQISGTKPKRLCVIHNTPPNSKQISRKLNSEKVKIGYFGIFSKGGRMLSELLRIVSRHTNWELHIGGFGPLEDEIKEYSNNFQNIIYYGKVNYNSVIEIEGGCDILTAIYAPNIPNHKYAAPNKFYEALMLGKPLIMIKGTGMSEVVQQYKIGRVVDYSEEALDAGIADLVAHREDWPGIKETMEKLYREKYSWNEMEKRLLNLYSAIYDEV